MILQDESSILDATIRNAVGRTLIFGSARHLMDDSLFETAMKFREEGAQRVWDAYCSMHGMQYDAIFDLNMNLFWGMGMTPEEEMQALRDLMRKESRILEHARAIGFDQSPEEGEGSEDGAETAPGNPKV